MRICSTPKCNEPATQPTRFYGWKCPKHFYALNLWADETDEQPEEYTGATDSDGRQQLGLFEDCE